MNAASAPQSTPAGSSLGNCPNCGFDAWWRSANLTPQELRRMSHRIVHRRSLARNECLYRAGSALTSLHVISSGFLKTVVTEHGGYEHITGIYMTGEMVGLDAIGTERHYCDTIALEDSRLCKITFSDFESLAGEIPKLQRQFLRVIGAEIARDYGIMYLLGGMRAEQRVAIFLLNLSKRFVAQGYSGTRFRLPMRRKEIASYLGLKLETVCRELSHMQKIDLVAVHGKEIYITDLPLLRQMGLDPESRQHVQT